MPHTPDREKINARNRARRAANPEKFRAIGRAEHAAFMASHPLYEIWIGIKKRCLNPRSKAFPNYGGRGITICDRWKDSYSAFEADMLPGYEPGLSIERLDNDGNYTQENCCWISRAAQARNQRRTVFVDSPWGRISMVEAAERSGIQPKTLRWRVAKGSPLFTPVGQYARKRQHV